jgi:transposase
MLAGVDGGLSCRQTAERFGVSRSTTLHWQALRQAGGKAHPEPSGGDRLSHLT